MQWQEAEGAEGPSAVNNDEVPKGMWEKQDGFLLRGSLWVLISKGQGEQVAGEEGRLKWQLAWQ